MREQFEKSLAEVFHNLEADDTFNLAADIWWTWADEGEDETAELLGRWGVEATTQDAIDLMESALDPEWEGDDATDEIQDFLCEITCKYYDPEA